MFPSMTQSPTLSTPIVTSSTFKFNCHINYDPSQSNVGFQVRWKFDNQTDPKVPVTTLHGTDRDAELDQKYLQNHLGKTVSSLIKNNTNFINVLKILKIVFAIIFCSVE